MFTAGPALLAGSAHDPYWSSVASLLHFDGTNGSTTFTDQVAGRTWTPSGTAQISNGQVKYGTGAFHCTSSTGTIQGTAAALGSTFTLEFYVYINVGVTPAGTFFSLTSIPQMSTIWDGTIIRVSNASVWTTIVTPSGANWYYIAISCSAGTAKLFNNGTLITSVSMPSSASTTLNYGNFQGYLDEARLTIGVSRYSASYTPPTGPFPNH